MFAIIFGLVAGFVIIRLLMSKTFWSLVALVVLVAVFGVSLLAAVNTALTVLWWLFVGAVVAGIAIGVMKIAERYKERNGMPSAQPRPYAHAAQTSSMYPYQQTYGR